MFNDALCQVMECQFGFPRIVEFQALQAHDNSTRTGESTSPIFLCALSTISARAIFCLSVTLRSPEDVISRKKLSSCSRLFKNRRELDSLLASVSLLQ